MMQEMSPLRLPIRSQTDVVIARGHGMDMALAMGFSSIIATQIATVISELARNIVLYAQVGTITLMPLSPGALASNKGVQIVAQDNGPGIPNVKQVLNGGYSTSNGMGLGLSGSKKLMDSFKIESMLGLGTTVTAVKYLYAVCN
jgi:serine/threonine-protein kinase RsbT